jgi:hypothetical protein
MVFLDCRHAGPLLAAQLLPLRSERPLPIGYVGASTGAAAVVVEGAGHPFKEPRTLETVARLAADWFEEHLHTPEPRLAATGS